MRDWNKVYVFRVILMIADKINNHVFPGFDTAGSLSSSRESLEHDD